MRLVSGLDLEGSGTVASSTSVRFSVSLTDAPGSPSYDEWIGWETSEVKTVPEAIVDDDHELVIERVCAIDVSKASGKVSRLSHRNLPGRRRRERVTHGCTRSSAPAGCTCSPALAPRWHEAYWRQIEDDVVQVSQLYDGARFFWAVPDYVPADQVAALPGLVRPEVTERMATLVVQGTTPGRGADDALSGARPLVRPGRGRLDLPGRGPGRSSRPSTLGSPPGTGSSPALAGAPPERGPPRSGRWTTCWACSPTRPGLADREPRRVRAAARAHARRPAAGPLHPRRDGHGLCRQRRRPRPALDRPTVHERAFRRRPPVVRLSGANIGHWRQKCRDRGLRGAERVRPALVRASDEGDRGADDPVHRRPGGLRRHRWPRPRAGLCGARAGGVPLPPGPGPGRGGRRDAGQDREDHRPSSPTSGTARSWSRSVRSSSGGRRRPTPRSASPRSAGRNG